MFKNFPTHFDFSPPKGPPVAPWAKNEVVDNQQSTNPLISDELKKAFGIELAKGVEPFKAACNCGQTTSQALRFSQNLINDPVVQAAKTAFLKASETSDLLLDKDQLAARLLKMADEKHANGAFYILDSKDRLKALELYAEVRGYTGKLAVDASTKTFNHTQMVIKFVKPDVKEEKQPVTVENEETDNLNIKSPLKLKLVSTG